MKIKTIIKEEVLSKTTLDFYIPATIEFLENNNDNNLLYYQMLNNNCSLVEFKINKTTGKIFNIVLISAHNVKKFANFSLNLENIIIEYGNPIIDIKEYSEKILVTSNKNYDIVSTVNKVFILFENNVDFYKKISMSNVDLLINKDMELVGCVFNNISLK